VKARARVFFAELLYEPENRFTHEQQNVHWFDQCPRDQRAGARVVMPRSMAAARGGIRALRA